MTSRRTFLARAAMAPLASPALAATAERGSHNTNAFALAGDADLIAVCREYLALEAAYAVAIDGHCETAEDEARLDAELTALEARIRPALERISEIPATTPHGLACKARCIKEWLPKTPELTDVSPLASAGERLTWSLCEDILLGAMGRA